MTNGCTVEEILHMQGLGEKPDAKNVLVGAPTMSIVNGKPGFDFYVPVGTANLS